jgi:hypothetical protein
LDDSLAGAPEVVFAFDSDREVVVAVLVEVARRDRAPESVAVLRFALQSSVPWPKS